MKVIAKILITNDKNEILLLRRSSSHPHYPQHLDLPGGEIEDEESSLDAVYREIIEETGLVIDPEGIELVHKKQFDPMTRHLLYAVSIALPVKGIKLSWEHDAYFWMTSDKLLEYDLPKNVDSYFKFALEYLSARQ